MTDLAAARMIVRRLVLPRPGLPDLGVGQTLSAVSALAGDAFRLAYVAPYAGFRRLPQAAPDEELEGRSPNW